MGGCERTPCTPPGYGLAKQSIQVIPTKKILFLAVAFHFDIIADTISEIEKNNCGFKITVRLQCKRFLCNVCNVSRHVSPVPCSSNRPVLLKSKMAAMRSVPYACGHESRHGLSVLGHAWP